MDRNEQMAEAGRLGANHGNGGLTPYGDLDDAGFAELMDALGETSETTAENHDHGRRLCDAYMSGWEGATGRTYATEPPPAGVLTPRGFVLALAADGIAADLDSFGGPGSWPMPWGYLPDGRGWILGDEDDRGWVGPDETMPGLVHLQVYESATENAGRWDDGHGLEFNDPIGILGRLSPVQAGQAIRRAWSGDYALFTDDRIGPAPLVEDALTDGGQPMFDPATRAYLRACRLASPDALAPYRTDTCPECGENPHGGGLVATEQGHAHVLIRGYVVLGCEGYWVVCPGAVGLTRWEWDDWRLTLDAGYINEDADGAFTVTLCDAYVGDPHARIGYPEALARLRAAVAELPQTGRGAEPPMFYVAHATGLVVPFPVRLAEVREDWDRRPTVEDAAWWGSLGPHIGVEAMCLLCGETCNPHGPDEMVHGQTWAEEPCGGPLVALGAWGAPVTPGRASAIRPVGPAGIPYAWTNPEDGSRTCPACQAVIAEDYDGTGEPLTANYAAHYQAEHGPQAGQAGEEPEPEPEPEYDPGPEIDDEGGMSDRRHDPDWADIDRAEAGREATS